MFAHIYIYFAGNVISMRCTIFPDFKLTKLFDILNFSGAKDAGKVLIIIVILFYNFIMSFFIMYFLSFTDS